MELLLLNQSHSFTTGMLLEELLNSVNGFFQNIIILTIGLIDEKTNIYEDTINEIEEILSLI